MTISLLAFSSLGDLWGYKRVYVLGLEYVHSDFADMCSFRFVYYFGYSPWFQGFSAAAITSVNTALLRVIFSARFLARGMGINGLIIAVAAAAGPTVAAGILAIADWPLVVCHQCAHRTGCICIEFEVFTPESGKSRRTTF